MAEVLMFLGDATVADEIGGGVVHRGSDRLVVVDQDAVVTGRIAGQSGSITVIDHEDDLTSELSRMMTQAERLFAQSWLLQRSRPPKIRPGDGADWDAPGREAPDPTSTEDARD